MQGFFITHIYTHSEKAYQSPIRRTFSFVAKILFHNYSIPAYQEKNKYKMTFNIANLAVMWYNLAGDKNECSAVYPE